MRYLELIVFLLVVKDVISSRCPFETETQYCDCGSPFPNVSLDIKCTSPLLPTNTTDQFFLIKLNETEININCSASLDWSNFDYQFSNELRESNAFLINNCIFEKNMNLIRFAELIRAKNTRELLLINTFQNDAIDFDDHLFKGFRKLEKLYIVNNENLTEINKNLLLFLPFLTEFHVVNSNLRSIPDDLLVYLPRITTLRLSNNNIRRLGSQSFKNVGTLELLDLSLNDLVDLPSDLFDSLINLETLLLYGNDLPYLPENVFSKLENLKYLYLGTIGLGSLLEHTFQNNRKLEALNLQDNYLKVLPNRIFDGLINLKVLKMDNNQLESLAEDIFSKTKNLVSLTLGQNLLTSFGDLTFRNLTKLEELDICRNRLDNLADTGFEKGQMGDFINTSSLFRGSSIEYETNDKKRKDQPLVSIFFNCSSLTHLYLSHNNIHKIHEDWFLMSKLNLQILDLSHNSITEVNLNRPLLQQHDFYVDLSHNQIASILPTNFSRIRIETGYGLIMNMSQNSFNCDCDIADLIQYLNLKSKGLVMNIVNIVGEDLKCDRPEKYRGLLLTSLKDLDLSCELPFYQYHNNSCKRECSVRIKYEENKNPNTRVSGHHPTYIEIYQFNCSHRNLTLMPEGLCIVPGTNVELDLTDNELATIPVFDNQNDYDAITNLDLSRNRIYSLNGISSFKKLQFLKIDNNEKTFLVLTDDALAELSKMAQLKVISFRRSLFSCNDNFFSLIQYEVASVIANFRELECVTSSLELIRPFLRHSFYNPNRVDNYF